MTSEGKTTFSEDWMTAKNLLVSQTVAECFLFQTLVQCVHVCLLMYKSSKPSLSSLWTVDDFWVFSSYAPGLKTRLIEIISIFLKTVYKQNVIWNC